jgi:hypothetical protein
MRYAKYERAGDFSRVDKGRTCEFGGCYADAVAKAHYVPAKGGEAILLELCPKHGAIPTISTSDIDGDVWNFRLPGSAYSKS